MSSTRSHFTPERCDTVPVAAVTHLVSSWQHVLDRAGVWVPLLARVTPRSPWSLCGVSLTCGCVPRCPDPDPDAICLYCWRRSGAPAPGRAGSPWPTARLVVPE